MNDFLFMDGSQACAKITQEDHHFSFRHIFHFNLIAERKLAEL